MPADRDLPYVIDERVTLDDGSAHRADGPREMATWEMVLDLPRDRRSQDTIAAGTELAEQDPPWLSPSFALPRFDQTPNPCRGTQVRPRPSCLPVRRSRQQGASRARTSSTDRTRGACTQG